MRIILCEGKTDAILLSYYLWKLKGWEYDKNPKRFKLKFPVTDNRSVSHYKKDEMELAICAVGGKDNFSAFYKSNIEDYIINSEKEDLEYRVAIVLDRDNRSKEEIELSLSEELKPKITGFMDGEWINSSFDNGFGQQVNLSLLGLIIPHDKQGALETLLLDALSEDPYKGNLIYMCKSFVDNITPHAKNIIATDRLQLKAKLGVSLAVLYPEKVFSLIDEQLKSIPWEQSEMLKECFKKLIEI